LALKARSNAGPSANAVIDGLSIEPLTSHPEALSELQAWFEAEWPSYYGAGGPGDAKRDLRAYSNTVGLPFGLVALFDGSVCGVAVLKADSIASHAHLSPWIAGGLVRPDLRRRGIGQQLVLALEKRAKAMGFDRIYCGTDTAEGLLRRSGWQLSERIVNEGEALGIYEKAL
jgi:GNAT superfamily N-acetyltransferase